ncbi:MAG: hypothetical protein AB9842_01685 [Bacteroidales bacterium]
MSELLLVLAYSLIIILTIRKLRFFRLDGIPEIWVITAFVIKIAASFILYLIYTQYYTDRSTADIFKYFDDSKVLYDILYSKPLDFISIMTGIGNDSPHFSQYYQKMNNWYGIYPSSIYGDGHIMIRLNAVFRLVSFGYYNVHGVFMSLLSFIGIIAMYKVFIHKLQKKNKLLFLLLFFFPSVVLWSSGVLKEGLVFLSLGLILYLSDLLLDTKLNWKIIFLIAFNFLVLRYTKFYLFIIVLPLVMGYFWSKKSSRIPSSLKYFVILSVTFLIGIIVGTIFPVYDIVTILARKQHDFLKLAIAAESGSIISYQPLNESVTGILTGILPGFLNTLLIPYPWDIRNMMMIIPSMENLFILGLLLVSFLRFTPPCNKGIFWFSVLLFLYIYVLTGLITPVAGAIVRYKTIAIPFLIYAVLLTWGKVNTFTFYFRK